MTGSMSVHTHYEGHEIMFHVSTLLPHSEDPQQVRKKIYTLTSFFYEIACPSCVGVPRFRSEWNETKGVCFDQSGLSHN